MSQHEKIDYVEFPTRDMAETKRFFTAVFGWRFTDYGDGPNYTAFERDAGLDGGFFPADAVSDTETGAALLVFYSEDLEDTQRRIEAAGGDIIRPTFEFPGGRRFHFREPGGNELAVWSDKPAKGL